MASNQNAIDDPKLAVSLLKDFLATPAGRELLEQRRAKETAARQALVDELADLQREKSAASTKAIAEVQALRSAEDDAVKVLHVARDKRLKAELDHLGRGHAFDVRRRDLERELRDSADPRITEAMAWLERHFHEDRDHVSLFGLSYGGNTLRAGSVTSETQRWIVTHNGRAVQLWLDAVAECRVQLDALLFVVSENLDRDIQKILAPVKAARSKVSELLPISEPQ